MRRYKIWYVSKRDGLTKEGFTYVGNLVTGSRNVKIEKLRNDADEYEKEDLYKARINYIEQDSKQTRYMMQLTSQSKRTALSNINNVLVLLDIGTIIRKISKGYPFEYATSDVLKNFQNDCVSGTKKYLDNGACKRINISVIQKDQDNELGIVRVILDIAFNNLIERIGISLQVGK